MGLAFALSAPWLLYWCIRPIGTSISAPVLRDIGVVELGESETGQVATGELTIVNDGNADLLIDGVRASCSCTGLETRNRDGSFTQLSSLTVPVKGQVPVVVRLAVNGSVGGQGNSRIYFSTNDPMKPEVEVQIQLTRITHGARATPEVIAIGTMPVGKSASYSVEIIDRSPTPRAVQRVAVTNPALVSATLLQVPDHEAPVTGGRIVARLQVQVDAKTVSQVDERVDVWLTSEKPMSPVSIRVIGRIAATAELSPATLVFPINTDSGPLYRASVLCRTHGSPAQLRLVDCPSNITVSLPTTPSQGAPQIVTIEQKATNGESSRNTVTIGVTVNGVETIHPISIISQP